MFDAVTPFEVCSWIDTSPTRYARKVFGDAVDVSVTTAVPLQPASASSTAASGAAIRRQCQKFMSS